MQDGRIIHFREELITDATDGTAEIFRGSFFVPSELS
jgi:hypothetical protein